jgi:hypothetical protein
VIPILVDRWHSDFEVLSQLSHCSRYLSLSMGALLGEPGGGGSFARGPEGYERKALGMGSVLSGAQLGILAWAHLAGTLRCG